MLASGCAAPVHWRSVEHESTFEQVWEQFERTASVGGFARDRSDTDIGNKVYVSRWRVRHGSFRQRRRSRLHAEFERVEEQASAWRVRFHIERQKLDNMAAGFETEEEDWADDGQDSEREEFLLAQLRLAFGQEIGIEPTYRRGR